MSNSNQLERLFKLQTQVNKLVLEGKRTPKSVADALQAILVEQSASPKFELYLFGKQKTGGWERGHDIEVHLNETGLINRCLSKDDDVVQGWLANPETYPKEFKDKVVFLWKSVDIRDGLRKAPYLAWRGGRVALYWYLLDYDWRGCYPAVLVK